MPKTKREKPRRGPRRKSKRATPATIEEIEERYQGETLVVNRETLTEPPTFPASKSPAEPVHEIVTHTVGGETIIEKPTPPAFPFPPAAKIEQIEIEKLSNDPANLRQHSERNIEVIVASLKRFGQQIPLVVDSENLVRVGNARLEAMRRLGWKTAMIIRTNLSGADLVAYAIADNRSGDPEVGSTFDLRSLSEALAALQAEDSSLVEAAGYSADDLSALVASLSAAIPPTAFPTFDASISTNYECPKCHFKWSGSASPSPSVEAPKE